MNREYETYKKNEQSPTINEKVENDNPTIIQVTFENGKE